MKANGYVAVSLVLTVDAWDFLDRLVQAQGHGNRRSFLADYLFTVESKVQVSALVLPLPRRKGVPVKQDKIMLPSERLPFLNRIKAELGLSYSDVICALILTTPDLLGIGAHTRTR